VKAAAHGRHPFEGFLLTQLEVLGKFAGGGGAAQALVQLISRLGLLLQMDADAPWDARRPTSRLP
jgi:hypothetical protein